MPQSLTLKLADMGEARRVGSAPKRATPPIPARNWVPPEVLAPDATAESYVLQSDTFGLGLIISEVCTVGLDHDLFTLYALFSSPHVVSGTDFPASAAFWRLFSGLHFKQLVHSACH